MQKKKLVLVTDGWPYGKGEKPFIEPELMSLLDWFEIVVVSTANESMSKIKEDESEVPDGVRVVRMPAPSKKSLITALPSLLTSQLGRNALWGDLSGGAGKLARIKTTLGYWGRAKSFEKQFKNVGLANWADVIYGFWLNYYALAFVLERSELKQGENDPFLCCRAHGYDLYNERRAGGRQPFHDVLGNGLDEIFFVSDEGKSYFERNFTKPDKKRAALVTSYLGVHPQVSAPIIDKHEFTGTLTIVSCSSVIPLKRVNLIAEGIAASGIKDCRWVHFGDGPSLSEVKAIADGFGIKTEFMGYRSNSEVLSWLSKGAADVFITTSSTEGLPVSVQEALYFGLPVIATDVGGMAELFDGNGVLLNANPTPAEVGEALKLILSALKSNSWKLMARSSRSLWEQRFDSEVIGPKFAQQLAEETRRHDDREFG